MPEKVNTALRVAAAQKSFYDKKDKMDRFLDENKDALAHLRKLADEHNEALDHYKQILRDHVLDHKLKKFVHGENDEFQVSAVTKTVQHPEVLRKAMDDKALIKAQAMRKKITYTLREKETLELVAAGKVSEDVFKKAFEKVPGTPMVRCPHNLVNI